MSKKIVSPNFTMMPNVMYDYWQTILSPGEFSVLSFLGRKIFGFHKTEDQISITQISKGTNQARSTVILQIKKLINHGLVSRKKGKTNKGDDDTNTFSLIIYEENGSPNFELGVVRNSDNPVVRESDTQKKTYTKENTTKQMGATAPVAVFSCLNDIDMTTTHKEWLTKTYPEQTVKDAVAYAKHPETKIKESVAKAITWACKERIAAPIAKEDLSKENMAIAASIEARVIPGKVAVICKSKDVEVVLQEGVHPKVSIIEYTNSNFKEAFRRALFDFKVPLRPKAA